MSLSAKQINIWRKMSTLKLFTSLCIFVLQQTWLLWKLCFIVKILAFFPAQLSNIVATEKWRQWQFIDKVHLRNLTLWIFYNPCLYDFTGQQLTIFNSQSKVHVGGKKDGSGRIIRPFKGTIAGTYIYVCAWSTSLTSSFTKPLAHGFVADYLFIQSISLRLLYHALWLVEKSNRPRSHVPRASWNCL